MLEIFFVFALYDYTWGVITTDYFTPLQDMTYGFKKNSNVSLKISDSSTQMVFGLATKKEIEKLNSIKSFYVYCDGNEKLFNLQFLIHKNTTFDLNFRIPTKNILIPVCVSCDESYKFSIRLDILNGKNHLDYRYQYLIIGIYISLILLIIIIIAIVFIYIVILHDKNKIKKFVVVVIPALFLFENCSLLYLLVSNNNEEIFKNSFFLEFGFQYGFGLMATSIIFHLLHAIHFDDLILVLFYIFSMGIIAIAYLAPLIFDYSFGSFIFVIPVFFLHVVSDALIPCDFLMLKISYIIFTITALFNYVLRFLYLNEDIQQIQTCQMIVTIESVSLVGKFLSAFVLLFEGVKFNFNCSFLNRRKEDRLSESLISSI